MQKISDTIFTRHMLFRVILLWRIIYGVLRIMLAIVLLHFVEQPVGDIFIQLMQHELIEDPQDVGVRVINAVLHTQSIAVSFFMVGYLVFWGIVDIALSVSLLRDRLWAFPVSLGALGVFVLYEIYRMTNVPSLGLSVVLAIDLVMIVVIYREYREKQHKV